MSKDMCFRRRQVSLNKKSLSREPQPCERVKNNHEHGQFKLGTDLREHRQKARGQGKGQEHLSNAGSKYG